MFVSKISKFKSYYFRFLVFDNHHNSENNSFCEILDNNHK